MASLVASGLITIAGATISTGIQAGDTIVAYVWRNGSNTQPSQPVEFASVASGNGSNSISGRVGSAVAAGTSFTYGAWTNGSNGIYLVYRPGAGETLAFGITGVSTAASGDLSYGGVTLNDTDGSSWVLGFGAIRAADTAVETAPSGMTARQSAPAVPATNEGAGHDTNGGVASWSTTTVTQGGTAAAWHTRVVEMTVTLAAQTITGALFTNTQTFYASAITTGAVTIDGALFSDADTFYGATVSLATVVSADSPTGGWDDYKTIEDRRQDRADLEAAQKLREWAEKAKSPKASVVAKKLQQSVKASLPKEAWFNSADFLRKQIAETYAPALTREGIADLESIRVELVRLAMQRMQLRLDEELAIIFALAL